MLHLFICKPINLSTWDQASTEFLNDFDNELQSVIEKYITMDIPKYHRSIIAQYRCGVIPIRIETGWFRGIDYVFYVL